MAVPCVGVPCVGPNGRDAGQGRAGQTLHNVMGILGGAQQQQRPLEGLVVCFEDRADEAKRWLQCT
jgi:hypothetical protein